MGFGKLMSVLVVMTMLRGYSFVPTTKSVSIPVPTTSTTQSHIPSDAPTMQDDEDDEYSGASGEGSGGDGNLQGNQLRCEELKIPLCNNLGYNYTALPNMFNHKTQDDAAILVHQFYPLIKVNCYKYLQLLVCSIYAPKCTPKGYLRPCRGFCEEARDGCHRLMSMLSLAWPSSLDCKQFHNTKDGSCISPPYDVTTPSTPTVQPWISTPECGGNITSIHGTLTSPNYPDAYPKETRCTWTIKLPKKYHVIEITLDVIELEDDRNCFYDFIIIFDKINNQVGPRHCGTYRMPYVTPVRGNKASIVFVSDENTSKKGFSLSYKGLL